MRTLLFTLLVGCAPQAMTTNAQHPANPDAPTGRLAGPPAALRPGVADVSTPTRDRAPAADHSAHGATPEAPAQDHSGHEGHPATGAEPPKSEPTAPEPTKTEPAKKPEPKQPAKKPRKQDKPPASKDTPGTDTSKQPPPAHQGHEGHH